MKNVIFDIETTKTYEMINSAKPEDFDISVVCIYESDVDRYSAFWEKDFDNLWPVLEKADMLTTFNGDHFDIPILQKYSPVDLGKIKSLDLLKEVKNSIGKRIKLDTIAGATLGISKSGNGLDAVRWWNEGEYEKIEKYCLQDVKVTKDVFDYALENGKLKYEDKGEIIDIPLETSNWIKKEENIINSLF